MVIQPADELRELVTNIFIKAGAGEADARLVAQHLVDANLRGVDTHGVWHVARYVDEIKAGHIRPRERPEIHSETPNHALVRGNWTFGHVSARFAIEVAIEKAAEQGIAVVGAVELNHTGRVGEYTELAAKRGMIAVCWLAGFGAHTARAAPHGGKGRVLDVNPISIGAPADGEVGVLLDYATTASSFVKIINARRENRPVPEGWVIDAEGRPTTDPSEAFEGGAVLPFGGHKGYALSFATEVLSRIFTGADDWVKPDRGVPHMRHTGMTMMVMKADLFQPLDQFSRRVTEFTERARDIPPAPGFEEVLVPGDPEARTLAVRSREGIPLPDYVWESLTKLVD